MARPPREDRAAVGSKHLAFRLNQYEFELMMMCVQKRNAQLESLGLPPLMNPTSFVKALILQEAERMLPSEDFQKRKAAMVAHQERDTVRPDSGGTMTNKKPRTAVVYGPGGKIVGKRKTRTDHR
jgi:hypothetical protein